MITRTTLNWDYQGKKVRLYCQMNGRYQPILQVIGGEFEDGEEVDECEMFDLEQDTELYAEVERLTAGDHDFRFEDGIFL